MARSETWSIPHRRIAEFFRSLPDVSEEDGCFRYRSCRIRLTALADGTLGRLRIPRTRLELEGSEEDIAAIYNRFFLRFLSAGG